MDRMTSINKLAHVRKIRVKLTDHIENMTQDFLNPYGSDRNRKKSSKNTSKQNSSFQESLNRQKSSIKTKSRFHTHVSNNLSSQESDVLLRDENETSDSLSEYIDPRQNYENKYNLKEESSKFDLAKMLNIGEFQTCSLRHLTQNSHISLKNNKKMSSNDEVKQSDKLISKKSRKENSRLKIQSKNIQNKRLKPPFQHSINVNQTSMVQVPSIQKLVPEQKNSIKLTKPSKPFKLKRTGSSIDMGKMMEMSQSLLSMKELRHSHSRLNIMLQGNNPQKQLASERVA